MRTNIFFGLVTVITNVAVASQDLPTTYSLNCWDGTFAYNQLETQVNGNQLNFNSSGQDLSVYANLINLPSKDMWGKLDANFSIPANNCKTSTADSKILTCQIDQLSINVTGTIDINTKIDEIVKLKNAVIQLRKVDELSIWGKNTSGYELVITSNPIRTFPSMTQRYFYGLEENETTNCKIN